MTLKRFPTKVMDEQKMSCLVCMSNPCNIVIVPCNHLAICKDCFDEMRKRFKDGSSRDLNCPCCRVPMDENKCIIVNYKPLVHQEASLSEDQNANDLKSHNDGPEVNVIMGNND